MARRRDILAVLGLMAAPVVAFNLWPGRAGQFDFAPMPGLPGFRRIDGGSASGLGDPFAGLAVPGAVPEAPPRPYAVSEVCAPLFGGAEGSGRVPVASFSDYYCPYCRVLTRHLAARDGADIAVRWHELPLLGAGSEAAARAALAADLQGGYAAFHERMMRASFQPTRAYLRGLAESLDLDPEAFLADIPGPAVDRRLDEARRLAATFGIAATPALVVGRTLVIGAIPEARLDALIEIERDAGAVCA